MIVERRRFRRVQIPARIRIQGGRRAPEVFEATAENISEGGVLLSTTHTLELNAKVLLAFTLPGMQKEIRVTGTVLHVSSDIYMGVRFDNLAAADKEVIQKFVAIAEPVPDRLPD
jgi:c-di-GMP-binding flagellar brake protein YcgR